MTRVQSQLAESRKQNHDVTVQAEQLSKEKYELSIEVDLLTHENKSNIKLLHKLTEDQARYESDKTALQERISDLLIELKTAKEPIDNVDKIASVAECKADEKAILNQVVATRNDEAGKKY